MTFDVDLQKVQSGFDGIVYYVSPAAGIIPGRNGKSETCILLAHKGLRSGSDVFFAYSQWTSEDNGKTWSGPVEHTGTLDRRTNENGIVENICGVSPGWHKASQTLFCVGQTVQYADDKEPITKRRRNTAYSIYNQDEHSWSDWDVMDMPDEPRFHSAGAGSAQRYDCDDGTILLPVYFKEVSDDWNAVMASTVVRCSFNGSKLEYVEHGSELSVPEPRGLCEPSITCFKGKYYLTLRNDMKGYAAEGNDGLHFDVPVPWKFDDGEELGSYNTQQHWVSGKEDLYLVYTRRGLDNDHVFRHRAPLMMAQVDPDNLTVIRETESELIPNCGARLGNFSVCDVSENEKWVIAAEWMQPEGCEKYGSDNTIWIAKIQL